MDKPVAVLEADARAESWAGWTSDMIHPAADKGVGEPASFVAKSFVLPEVGGDETLFISALGLYRCFINGSRVGEDLLTPGWTSYDKRLAYQVYPVAEFLVAGENRIEIWLADGWYRSQLMWGKHAIYDAWGDKIAAIAELRTSANAGAAAVVKTDASWKSGALPILKSGIYFGEIYDARLEELTESAGVDILDFDRSVLVAQETECVRELEPLQVRDSWDDEEGRTIYDFGQNCGGYVTFTVEGTEGARLLIEHSEILDQGRFENANYRTAEARIEYTLKGGGAETYRPYFTFQGYRFARVTIEGDARIKHIESIPISSAQTRTGWLSTGHALVNQLVENTVWSQRSNFIDVPTDCPQRDERLGWTGDAQVFAGTSCYLFDSHSFWRKWLRDVVADQRESGEIAHVSPDPTRLHPDKMPLFFGSTGWGDAICVVPWVLYQHYGDADVLEETLPSMIKWVDYVWSLSDGPLVNPPGWGERGFSFGDWLQPKGSTEKPLPTIGDDAAATIYLYIASDLAARAASALGDEETAQRLRERARAVKEAFIAEFVTATGRVAYNDQTSYALAILYDLVPRELLPKAVEHFKVAIARSGGRIGTGFIGTPALLPALTKAGEIELAEALFLQEEAPGWLYQIKNGATTIWERWDAIRPDGRVFEPRMNSFNHYAYGAVCQWLFESVAGIRPDAERPGFVHVYFEPAILPKLGPVEAGLDTAVGKVEAGWSLQGDTVTYRVSVPDAASGTLILAEGYDPVSLDGSPAAMRMENGKSRCLLAPGRHEIVFRVVQRSGLAIKMHKVFNA